MKSKIVDAVKSSKKHFESPDFLEQLLKGGYELAARDEVFKNLSNKVNLVEKEAKIDSSNKVADIKISMPNAIIEFGHNGTWQTQTENTGLYNKVVSDINKFKDEPTVQTIYTIDFLTDIKTINENALNKIKGYEKQKIGLSRESATKKIETVKKLLHDYECRNDNDVFQLKFENVNSGFEVDIYIFILGPFPAKGRAKLLSDRDLDFLINCKENELRRLYIFLNKNRNHRTLLKRNIVESHYGSKKELVDKIIDRICTLVPDKSYLMLIQHLANSSSFSPIPIPNIDDCTSWESSNNSNIENLKSPSFEIKLFEEKLLEMNSHYLEQKDGYTIFNERYRRELRPRLNKTLYNPEYLFGTPSFSYYLPLIIFIGSLRQKYSK